MDAASNRSVDEKSALLERAIYAPVAARFQVYMIFFFSSRRRHTICSGDWSSDVCSSDLKIYALESIKLMPPSKRGCSVQCSQLSEQCWLPFLVWRRFLKTLQPLQFRPAHRRRSLFKSQLRHFHPNNTNRIKG